jgi:hypothetical protein
MDDESKIIDEASSRLEILFSAQTEEVKRLLTTTVKGKTRRSFVLRGFLILL